MSSVTHFSNSKPSVLSKEVAESIRCAAVFATKKSVKALSLEEICGLIFSGTKDKKPQPCHKKP